MSDQTRGQQSDIPASCMTVFLAGGSTWAVDEEVEDVVNLITSCILGTERSLKLHADRRPIYFSRALLESWVTAWPIRRVPVSSATVLPMDGRQVARR